MFDGSIPAEKRCRYAAVLVSKTTTTRAWKDTRRWGMKLGRRRRRWGAGRGMHPTRAVAVSFGAMIALGTLALLLKGEAR